QPDLNAHLAELDIVPKHYARQILGVELTSRAPLEALGLPLKLKQRNLGVLVLFRRANLEQVGLEEGFTTTDPAVLQEAADNLAAMVSAQLYHIRVEWEREEAERHAKVCEAVQTSSEKSSPEEALCREMIRSFRAKRAALYLVAETR